MPADPFIAPTTELHTYTGVCRCKANKFTIELPELTGALKCNCSICSVHGTYWIFRKPDAAKFEREGEYIEYEWNENKFTFYFCATCGNLVKAIMKSNGGLGVNVGIVPSCGYNAYTAQARILQDVDIWSLKDAPFNDGASRGPTYKPAEFSGPPFPDTAADDKTKIYHGNCHCGAVTIALRSKPLAEVRMNECNCAYCWKVYPSSDNVHIGGVENLKAYMSNPAGGGFFCKKCGVAMLDADLDGAQDGDGKPIASAKETLGHDLHICAINARVLRGVDWDEVKPNRYDGRANDPQFTAD